MYCISGHAASVKTPHKLYVDLGSCHIMNLARLDTCTVHVQYLLRFHYFPGAGCWKAG